MSERKTNFQNPATNDIEKFLLLLSDLRIIDSDLEVDEDSDLEVDADSDSDLEVDADSDSDLEVDADFDLRVDLDADLDIDLDSNVGDDLGEELENSKQVDQSNTIDLFQELLLGSQPSNRNPQTEVVNPPLDLEPELVTKQSSRDKHNLKQLAATPEAPADDEAIHILQDILVSPELQELQRFKIAVEQKLGLVEEQVNNPALLNKIAGLESLIQNASLDLSNFGSKLSEIGNGQGNIPMEIANVSDRLAQLEIRIYQPEELVQLLLPVIADLLSIKASQSREEMCKAIMPIIAEVILERSQLDHAAMSHAIANILPNAISEQIRTNPEAIALAIAPEIGAAIREQIRLDRDAIIEALAPEMGSAIKRQIDLERDSMVDALYPVIGNTISKYFAEAIRSINEKVEQTFSIEGLQRKIRAKVQGVSEAELILQESVPFEVQAIFLIHNLSGLVMVDIQKSDLDSQTDPIDSDMLAGMLTAIRSFAHECMSRSSSNRELDAINYSGSKILLEVAGYCYLAVIIQGEPDRSLVNKIRDMFAQIVQVHGDYLKQFDGDPSIIPAQVAIELKTLIEINPIKSRQKSIKTLIFTGCALLALFFVPIAIYQYQANRDRQLTAKVLEAIVSTPELAVYRINVTTEGDRLKLSGKLPNQRLRDRAQQVATEAAKSEIAIAKLNIDNQIYAVNVPPDPILVAIEVQRLTKAFNHTTGVQIASEFQDGQVTITGQIEQPRLISKITQAYAEISGVITVTNATTTQIPKLFTRIYFPFRETAIPPTELAKLLEIQTFLELYPDYHLKIFAKSDYIGDRTANYQLVLKRCEAVREALLQRGIKPNRLHISGIIETSIQQSSDQISRWVEFEPELSKPKLK